MKDYVLARFQEASTYRAIIWCLAAFGVYHLSTDQASAVTALGMALAGAGGFAPDRVLIPKLSSDDSHTKGP
jgi:hypothetical protein